ncbi:cryptochrome/photolyase family protein [Kordiimonas sp.]|uniref:cryptochrome/photolyase family protein n=1 Tax=Kordiimonas sp. TaxID=1970157 RepID=UPI003A9311F8
MSSILVLMAGSLRLDDNPALLAACKSGRPVLPVFILDNENAGTWAAGGARRWWLLQSLIELDERLKAMGSMLVIRSGNTCDIVGALLRESAADAVYMNRLYSPSGRKLQETLHETCTAAGVECRRFSGNLLLEPEHIVTKTGKPYEVFSPFWRQAKELIGTLYAYDAPSDIPSPPVWPESNDIDTLGLEPKPAYWAKPIVEAWQPGETTALERLDYFLDEIASGYARARDVPGVDGTSRLSPYLVDGEISVRRIWAQSLAAADANPLASNGIHAFLRELGWRDFSTHLLFHFPEMPERPLKANFNRFPWQHGEGGVVTSWQKGKTGFPIIDAGMRQLRQTGWMHNRVRMIVASFLVKDLLWHWRDGANWFWDTLVDADLANNSASWQWVAGCGADAAPYFRIFNPVLQGEKFDKRGAYIREFVPELAALPDAYIHKPFEAPREVLEAAGITLGKDYPVPVIDRKASRERALAALARTKD